MTLNCYSECFFKGGEGSVEGPYRSLCAMSLSSAAQAKGVQEIHGLPLTQVDICPKVLPRPDQGDNFHCCLAHVIP